MVPVWSGQRVVLGIGGLLVLLLAEAVWPFRPPVDSRWRRYRINVCIMGSNALCLSVLVGGLLVAAYQSFELRRVGIMHALGLSPWWNVAVTVVLLDGVTYAWHYAYHHVACMWRMHRVHHSDRDMDVTTSGRFHLTEMMCSALFRLVVIAACGANLASVVIFEAVFGLCNQLEHSNVQLPAQWDRALRTVCVTPAMHRVHHSERVEHTNANYGTIFSVWDRLCGTYRCVTDQRELTLGLPEYQRPDDVTFGQVLRMPFGPPCGAGHRRAAGVVLPISS